MATLRWLDRLRVALAPGSVSQVDVGRVVPVSLAADMAWQTSREGNPRGWFGLDLAQPGAGIHSAIGIAATTPQSHQVAIARLLRGAAVAYSLAELPDLDALTWTSGPTASALGFVEQIEEAPLIRFVTGTIATANLPTATFELPFYSSGGVVHTELEGSHGYRSQNDVVIWTTSANVAFRMAGLVAALRR